MFSEAWKLELDISEGLDMPKPPSLTGRASHIGAVLAAAIG